MVSSIFHTVFYGPLFKVLVFLYNVVPTHDFGLVVIILTILIRLILFPLFYKGAKDQSIMQRLQPKIRKIQETLKENREEQARALINLYREHKINPFSQFLIIFIQLPILFALYWVVRAGLKELPNHYFFGVVDLSQKSFIIIILAALAQYFQAKLVLPKKIKKDGESGQEPTAMEMMSRQMVFIGPILTITILFSLPSAIGLYWLTTSIFSAIQQMWINKQLNVSEEKLVEIDKKLHKE